MNIATIRQKYPQYGDLGDRELSDALYTKFYSDMPRAEFDAKIGGTGKPGPEIRSRDPSVADMLFDFASAAGLPAQQMRSDLGRLNTAVEGAADALTFNLSDEIVAGIKSGFGLTGDYSEELARERARLAANRELAPGAALAGGIAGGLTGGAGVARKGLTLAQRFAGAPLHKRIAAGAAEGALYGGAYGAGAGEDAEDRAEEAAEGAALGAGIGAAVPAVGSAIRAFGEAAYNQIAPRIRAVVNPEQEAARRVGEAFRRDAQMQQFPLSRADEAAGFVQGQDVRNFDRGGETVRALTRSVANQSPESRGVIERVVSDRFVGQTGRLRAVIDRVAGGVVDDFKYQDMIREAARKHNKPRYDRAFNSPAAQSVWDGELEQLMQSPAMQQAAKQATSRAADRAAVEGFRAVRNPFEFGEAGISLKQNADGSTAVPNLQFWDQVKRNLDSMIGKAQSSGDRTRAADIIGIKKRLVEKVDGLVPDYAVARQGAAAFFGAEDALEAGRKFVFDNRNLREAIVNLRKMSQAEREAFKTGFAAELTEKLGQTSERRNIVNQIFATPNSRDKIRAVFGRDGMDEFESFVKVETAIDMMRGALGNSTTARQLVELGLGAGAGYGYSGDITGALIGAAVAKGARVAGAKIEERVLREVAETLLSTDRTQLAKAARQIAKSATRRKALDAIMDHVEAAAKIGTISQAAGQPAN